MIFTCLADRVVALAPAKLNLFLELLGRRDDGYHELETLMVAITIFDTIVFSTTVEDRVRLTCSVSTGVRAHELAMGRENQLMGDVPTDGSNLIVRAVERLREAAGVTAGAAIHLIKAHSLGGWAGWSIERRGDGNVGRQLLLETGMVALCVGCVVGRVGERHTVFLRSWRRHLSRSW